ncbi:hypothetical protein DYH09_14250 [bacterium CPR1]|nr:hypothetical protein [bacterium CPR1]
MNLIALAPMPTRSIRLGPATEAAPRDPDTVTLSSANEHAYRRVATSMGIGALAGAVAGGVAGLALGFHPTLLATAGLVTGAWGGLAVGYYQALRDLP